MALTTDEQKFFDFAKAALPAWIPDGDEFLMGAAKMFGSVRALIDYLFGQTLIGNAVGAGVGTPDWLNQHANDRGTRRQLDEEDPALRERLRNIPEALTRLSIIVAIDAIIAAEGIVGNCALVELPRHGAHSGEYTSDTGTGGTFVKVGTVVKFAPATVWAGPPYRSPLIVPVQTTQIVISGAANGGNDGTYPITGLEDDQALYVNAGGVAAVDPGVTWTVEHLDLEGNVRDGFTRAYSQRGYRSARLRPGIIVVILPFGSTLATVASVTEALRQKKAAGIAVRVERRLIAP